MHLPCKRHAATALSTRCHSSRGAFVPVVSAVRVHFLTLIDNYPISQRANTARNFVSVVSVRANTICGVRFCCISPLLVSGCKVITLQPINQTICGKSLVKNYFIKN